MNHASTAPQVLDLAFLGLPQAIAAFAVRGSRGWVLVESGPMTTLPRLLDALAALGVTPTDVGDVLLTHVHLDHAGAAGWWAEQGAQIHVHALGAPHLLDPSRLMASAGRVYGPDLDRLWGGMPAVAAERLTVHDGDAAFEAGGLAWDAFDTPGHARHHLCYRFADCLFTGDVGGIRVPGCSVAVAPTPPPDIDIPAWKRSLARLSALEPARLYLTHFGVVQDVQAHLRRVEEHLEAAVARLQPLHARGADRETMVAAFEAWQRERLELAGVVGQDQAAYLAGNPSAMAVDGICRALSRESALSTP